MIAWFVFFRFIRILISYFGTSMHICILDKKSINLFCIFQLTIENPLEMDEPPLDSVDPMADSRYSTNITDEESKSAQMAV